MKRSEYWFEPLRADVGILESAVGVPPEDGGSGDELEPGMRAHVAALDSPSASHTNRPEAPRRPGALSRALFHPRCVCAHTEASLLGAGQVLGGPKAQRLHAEGVDRYAIETWK